MASFHKIKMVKEAFDKYGGKKGKASSLGGGGASMLGDGPQKVKGKVDQVGGSAIGVSGGSSSSKNPEGLKKPTKEIKRPGVGKNAEQPDKKKGDAAKTNWMDLVNILSKEVGKGVGEGVQKAKGKIDRVGMAVIGVSAASSSKKPEWLKKAKEIKKPGKIGNGKVEQSGLKGGEVKDLKGRGKSSTLGETKQKINKITNRVDAIKPEEGRKNKIAAFPNQLGETSKNFGKAVDGPRQHDKPVSASQNGLEKAEKSVQLEKSYLQTSDQPQKTHERLANPEESLRLSNEAQDIPKEATQEKSDDNKPQKPEDVKLQVSKEAQEVQPELDDQSKEKDVPKISEEMAEVAVEEAEVAVQKEAGEVAAGDENGDGISADNADISPEGGDISDQSARDVRAEKEQQEEQQVKELEAEAELGLPLGDGPLVDATNLEAIADEGSNIDVELFNQPTHSGSEFDVAFQNRLADWNEQHQRQIEEREVDFQHQQAALKEQNEHEKFDEQAREMQRLAAEAISRVVHGL